MGIVYAPATTEKKYLRRLCAFLVKNTQSWVWVSFVFPLATVSIPAILVLALSRPELGLLEKIPLASESGGYKVFFIVLAVFIPVVAKALGSGIVVYSKPEKEIDKEDLLFLIRLIESVIGKKLERFSEQIKTTKNESALAGDIFNSITQPRSQIKELVEVIYEFFCHLDTSVTFKVGLLSVQEKKPVAWQALFPSGWAPSTTIEALTSPTSTASRCIEKKEILVIDDVRKERKKSTKKERNYIAGGGDIERGGSLLCFPVFDSVSHDPIYVITIKASASGSLKSIRIPVYEWILHQICVRIQLEQCLLTLKENQHAQR